MRRLLALAAAALAFLGLAAPAAAQTPQVSGKSTHTLGLDAFGVAYAWGSDSFGQLGTGRTVYVPFPAKLQAVPQMSWLSAGREHVAAIDTTGFVWTWGASSDGKLGSRTGPDPDVPRRVVGISGVTDVAAGGTFTVALRADGSVWYWGTLPGVGSTLQPTRIAAVPVATQLAAGDGHFLARLSDGRVWVAGRNDSGQLGLGHAASPVAGQVHPTLAGIARVAAMDYASAALKAGSPNVPYGWGLYFPSMVPTTPGIGSGPGQFPPGANFGDVAVQGNFPTALLTNGDIWQWTGTPVDSGHPGGAVPVGGTANVWNQGGANPMGGLGTGINHVYAWDFNFNLYAFGFNADGALGTGNLNDAYPVPALVPTHKFVLVRGGFNYAVGLKNDGTVWAWGSNSSGQLADARYRPCDLPNFGTCNDPLLFVLANERSRVAVRPVEVALDTPDTLVQVSAGYGFSLARTINGEALSWGVNSSGELGQGNYATNSRPRYIAGLTSVTDIAASVGHALFLRSNGTVWETGGLPNVSFIKNVPTQVAMPEAISRVFAGEGRAYAVTAAGRLYAWGNNFWGELGVGDTSPRSVPTLIAGTGTGSVIVREVSAGPTHTLARLADGRVFAWGDNSRGQLGNGSFNPSSAPQQVPGITNAVSIAAGLRFSVVVLADGTMRSFGANDHGKLGDGSSTGQRTSPVVVEDLDVTAADPDVTKRASIVQATAGYNTAVALRTGGTVYAWGTSGTSPDQTIQEIETLGDAKLVPRNRPSLVLAPTDDGLLDNGLDWFLDLDVPLPDNRPAFTNRNIVPVTRAFVGGGEVSLAAGINFRLADYGKTVGTYILGVVPPSFLDAAKVAKGTSLAKAKKNGEMVLVMLTPDGWATVTGQLVAFNTSTINANGGANNILNGIPTAALTGAKFCIGYGETAGNMIAQQTLDEVLALPGAPGNVGGIPCLVSGAYVSGPPSSNSGSPVTFKATVIGTSPTGNVSFRDYAATISGLIGIAFPVPGNETVATAEFTTSSLAQGQHSIAVTYHGDAQNPAADTAYGVSHIVSPLTTGSATYLAGPSSSSEGEFVTFTATITGNNPKGTVQFKDGGANLGAPQAIFDGQAAITVNTLALGAHSVTAVYGGDTGSGGTNTGSTSNAVAHTVYAALTSGVSLAASANPSPFLSSVTLTASVTGPGTTSGTVTFRDGGSPLATVPVAGGLAQFSTALFPAGVRQITADYAPDAAAVAGGNTAVSSPTFHLGIEVVLDPLLDEDGDGIPNGVEKTEGTSAFAKDNDLFSSTEASARLFTMQQYRDFVGREADAFGLAFWTNAVFTGSWTRPAVIDAFLNSAEFAGFVAPVVRLYFATYLRVPDYAGLTFNAGLVRNGTVTLAQLADFFTSSPEFVALYGALDNTQFVTLLYANVLGRAPDPAGLSGWVALLNGGYTRGQVLLGFSDSTEYQAAMANEVFVTMMYSGMLRRTAEPGGFNGWLGFLDAGTFTREQVINGFFLSSEYRARFLPY
jgi:alpha-tubulin suppressor-like RCC1 family protein